MISGWISAVPDFSFLLLSISCITRKDILLLHKHKTSVALVSWAQQIHDDSDSRDSASLQIRGPYHHCCQISMNV